jgi:hypothetical protein
MGRRGAAGLGLGQQPSYNWRIRKVANGVITTVASNGTEGFSGDNRLATNAALGLGKNNLLTGPIAVDQAGNLYIPDVLNNRIRKGYGIRDPHIIDFASNAKPVRTLTAPTRRWGVDPIGRAGFGRARA